jgi:putative transposase
MVTYDRENLFGRMVNGDIELSESGRLAFTEWEKLSERFTMIDLDEFVIMPNHVHGIIIIADNIGADLVGARQKGIPYSVNNFLASPLLRQIDTSQSGSLGAIIGSYKSTVARIINGLLKTPGATIWQRNYYEHIIRNETEYESIREYIANNPFRWESDEENQKPGIRTDEAK